MAPRKSKRAKVLAKRAAADVFSAEDLQAKLGIGRNQLYEALAGGKIPGAFRLGRRWLIPRVAYERMLSGNAPAATTTTIWRTNAGPREAGVRISVGLHIVSQARV
jgi:Helix-turn-helix domain